MRRFFVCCVSQFPRHTIIHYCLFHKNSTKLPIHKNASKCIPKKAETNRRKDSLQMKKERGVSVTGETDLR